MKRFVQGGAASRLVGHRIMLFAHSSRSRVSRPRQLHQEVGQQRSCVPVLCAAPAFGDRARARAGAGGHAEFGPRGAGSEELQLDLLRYLKVKFSGWNRISMERVVSGTGICNIYDFLAYRDPAKACALQGFVGFCMRGPTHPSRRPGVIVPLYPEPSPTCR